MHPITENMIPEVELSQENKCELAVYAALDRIHLRGMDEKKVLGIFRISQESISKYKPQWEQMRAKELKEKNS